MLKNLFLATLAVTALAAPATEARAEGESLNTAALPLGASTNDISIAGVSCHVNANNVNYRSGPGTNYPSYGQVHKGRGFWWTVWNSRGWCKGNIKNGRDNVWIYCPYLTC